MFTSMGLHIIKNPAGTYSFVGSIPANLCEWVPATSADVMAGRAQKNPNTGTWVAPKKPIFTEVTAAVDFAINNDARLCESPTCACRTLFK